jgi:hypothetical protein
MNRSFLSTVMETDGRHAATIVSDEGIAIRRTSTGRSPGLPHIPAVAGVPGHATVLIIEHYLRVENGDSQ